MSRALLAVLATNLATTFLSAAPLPPWWEATLRAPRLESDFVQHSESEVFGTLQRKGTLQVAKGGRLRVAYAGGMLVIADGAALIQYDPAARTAQRMDLRSAAADMPLLNVLLDPKALEASYRILPSGPDRLKLEPRRSGLPPVALEGRGGYLRSIAWSDPTGARQTLELKHPKVPSAAFPASAFTFSPPAGTRWLGMK